MYVYADNAATTAMSQVAIDAMLPYFNKIYGNPSSLHSVGQEAKEQLEELMESVRTLLAERNQTENEGIKVSNAGMSAGIVGIGMSFAKRFVILAMAAYVLICIPSVFFKKKCRDSREV